MNKSFQSSFLEGGIRMTDANLWKDVRSLYCREVSVKLVKKRNVTYSVNSPMNAVDVARKVISQDDRENFIVLCLDTKNKINSVNIVHIGTVNATLVSQREIFKVALLANATSIICIHNHPSGDPTPSEEDRAVLQRIKEAGKILGICLADFIILGDESFYSCTKEGEIDYVEDDNARTN